jgi:leucine dehydrogenase
MDLYEMPDFDAHEQVLFGYDIASGLRAIIAIHSTVLGPAAGGCRMWPYATSAEAVADALRLARGMSYKNAMANLPFGGGKSVILGDSRQGKPREALEAFGRLVDSLGGRYITAEDVGTSPADMERIARVTPFVSGRAHAPGEAGGDPGPKTALGVYLGIRAAVRFRLGRTDLAGLTVAVQGVGGVGEPLCRLLAAEGVRLKVADARAAVLERIAAELGAEPVPAERILSEPADVLAPCALGAVLDERSIPALRAPIVAGAANNQLARDSDGQALMSAGVLYAPDYVINAGGIISAAREYQGGFTAAQVRAEIEQIPGRLAEIFERARCEGQPTNVIADRMARERLGRGSGAVTKTARAARA